MAFSQCEGSFFSLSAHMNPFCLQDAKYPAMWSLPHISLVIPTYLPAVTPEHSAMNIQIALAVTAFSEQW